MAYGGMCGANVYWEFMETGTLRIYGTGAMDDYDDPDGGWFVENPAPWLDWDFHRVVIEEGITYIGNNAFMGCSSLTSVTLPSTLEDMGSSPFSNTGIESLTIPEGIESISNFEQMTKLKSITLPSTLTRIEYMTFTHCTSLESIIIPENVTFIGAGAFSNCWNLTEITFLGSQPTLGNTSFGLGTVTSPVTTTVYTSGWGSDDVFTSDIRGIPNVGVYTTFIYETLDGGAVTIPVNVNGTWKDATPYANVNGVWKEITVYMNVNGTWKESV